MCIVWPNEAWLVRGCGSTVCCALCSSLTLELAECVLACEQRSSLTGEVRADPGPGCPHFIHIRSRGTWLPSPRSCGPDQWQDPSKQNDRGSASKAPRPCPCHLVLLAGSGGIRLPASCPSSPQQAAEPPRRTAAIV